MEKAISEYEKGVRAAFAVLAPEHRIPSLETIFHPHIDGPVNIGDAYYAEGYNDAKRYIVKLRNI